MLISPTEFILHKNFLAAGWGIGNENSKLTLSFLNHEKPPYLYKIKMI